MTDVAVPDAVAAEATYRRAIAADPADHAGWFGLGSLRLRAGDHQAAIDALEHASRLRPDDVPTLYNLAMAFAAAGRLDRAERAYRTAIAIDPSNVRARNNLADLLRRRSEHAEALALYREAVRLAPDYTLARRGLADTLTRLRRGDEAAEVLAEVVRREPGNAEAVHSLAMAQLTAGDTDAARETLDRALALRDVPAWRVKRAMMMPIILDSIEERDRWRADYARGIEALAADPTPIPSKGLPGPPFRLCYQGLDDRPLQETLARALRRRCPDLTYVAPHIGRPRRPGPYRVGFASTALRFHTVGRLMGALVAHLRSPDLEITVFQGGREDETARRIAAVADRAVRFGGTLADRQRAVAAAELDLLIYPEIGMEQGIWHLAFSRLAPIQAVTWGHPDTTGIDTIDVYLSAVDHEPEDGDRHYSERLVRLAAMPMILGTMPPAIPFDRAQHGLPAGVPLLACLQSPFKIHPDSDDLFARVLRSAPEALLVIPHWVEPVWVDRIHRRFARAHPDVAERLVHIQRLEHRAYLGFVQECAGLLDPPHFTGGQSTLEAFSLGTPVVTLPGALMRGRLTYGFYRRLGIDEAIARDGDDYARIAARLVRDRPWRDDLAQRIRSAAGERLVHDLTGADALRDYVRGLAGLG